MNPFDPMPTIKAILGWPVQQDIAESIMLARLDDFEAPQCEDLRHDIEPAHHSGVAEYLFIPPCNCGVTNFYMCADQANWMRSESHTQCNQCYRLTAATELIFLPIGPTS